MVNVESLVLIHAAESHPLCWRGLSIMRTLYTILIGLALVLILRFVGNEIAGSVGQRKAMVWFFPIWFVAMAGNLINGMRHGYGFDEELLFFMLNFGLPCLFAAFCLHKQKT